MIIVKILGGLGNQLFQYAAAKALATQHQTPLKLDVSGFSDYQLRNFELGSFHTSFEIATESDINQYKATGSISRIKASLTAYSKKHFYKQPYFHFDKNFFKLPGNVYLQGYFQSEKYFLPVYSLIQKELTLKNDLTNQFSGLVEKMKQQNSVALHIRRGDYKNADALKVHGILPAEYYHKALQRLQKQFQNPVVYLFSDDPEVSIKELNVNDVIPVSGAITKNHFEDLYLMSQCSHNIIANSSFSWWGAWLNKNPDKIVISPKNWFNEGPKDTYDIMPEKWISI